MKEIPLTQGKVALVDDEDFEYLNQFKWCALRGRNVWYAVRAGESSLIYMHRLILRLAGDLDGDHRDGDGLNNQRGNLRISTKAKNARAFQTPRQNKTSQFRGVCKRSDCNRWRAKIRFNYQHILLGLFITEEDAARAYDRKAIELGFTKEALNFPDEHFRVT